MTPNLQAIALACARECERQGVGLAGLWRLLEAYDRIMPPQGPPTERVLRNIANTIEPQTHGRYRRTPVTFANGGSSCPPGEIPENMERLFSRLDSDTDPDEFTRNLLQIHPFTDGNGRVAFIIYNWLSGTLHDPKPLPYYFGEDGS